MTPMIYGGRAPARGLAHGGARHACADCNSYAYHAGRHPVAVGKILHHPNCPRLAKAEETTIVGRLLAFLTPEPAPVVQTAGLFSADVTAKGADLVSALSDAIQQLDTDVTMDACGEWYTTTCKGSIPAVDALESKLASMEASGKTLDANSILDAAGVSATPSNISTFAKCVKAKEDKTAGVPRGTLAYCAIFVRDSVSPDSPLLPKAHSTAAWRDRWQTFVQSFLRFSDKYQTESSSALGNVPSDSEVSAQLKQYTQFRTEFVDNGGTTSSPSIGEPWSITAWAIALGIAGVVGYVAVTVITKRLGG